MPTAASDTQNALAMMDRSKPSCILWHDYGNPEYPELTPYFDELSTELDMVHVEDTKLCAHFQGVAV